VKLLEENLQRERKNDEIIDADATPETLYPKSTKSLNAPELSQIMNQTAPPLAVQTQNYVQITPAEIDKLRRDREVLAVEIIRLNQQQQHITSLLHKILQELEDTKRNNQQLTEKTDRLNEALKSMGLTKNKKLEEEEIEERWKYLGEDPAYALGINNNNTTVNNNNNNVNNGNLTNSLHASSTECDNLLIELLHLEESQQGSTSILNAPPNFPYYYQETNLNLKADK